MKAAVTPDGLTLQEERFCQAFVRSMDSRSDGNASAACREAYPNSLNWTTGTLNVQASRILARPKVRLRIQHLIEAEAHALGITEPTVLHDLEQDRQLARENNQAAAAITATLHKGKHIGMWQSRVDVSGTVQHTVSLEGLSPEELRDLAAAARERRAIEGEYREVGQAPDAPIRQAQDAPENSESGAASPAQPGEQAELTPASASAGITQSTESDVSPSGGGRHQGGRE